MSRLKTVLLTTSFLAALLAGGGLVYAWHWNSQPLPLTTQQRVELLPGQSFSSFAATLADQGFLDHPRLWSAMARASGSARRVQAGEYWLRVGDSPASVLERLLSGDVIFYEVKLLEGWRVRQALGALADEETLIHALVGADETTVLGALGLPEGNGEGLFFPDTYRYERGASDADIMRRAYQKLQTTLTEFWEERDAGLPYESPYDALIVASLIEKETGRDEDRRHIAQVFVGRLNLGMRLQTDPSVIYGVGETFDGNLTRAHLRTDTPYNSYTRKGLPPTPIALVSAKSLAAAVHPAGGEYLYFVSRGDGSSEFSVSLEEHEAAVRKYQLR